MAPDLWASYIQRDDAPFLNRDEFNKTIIDHALDACNYPFLKYLMDNGFIWFVGKDKKEYYLGFGAGTSIKRKLAIQVDNLDSLLKYQDDLRFKMISLAIRNKDFDVLERLHAREIPMLYTIDCPPHLNPRDDALPSSNNVNSMLLNISSCPSKTLDYFFDEYGVQTTSSNINRYVFPYLGNVLDLMIKKKRKDVSVYLEKMINRNTQVYKQLQELIKTGTTICKTYYNDSKRKIDDDDFIRKQAIRDYNFYDETGFVAFMLPVFERNTGINGFITNIIKSTAKSSDSNVQYLIDELNKSYNLFSKINAEKKN